MIENQPSTWNSYVAEARAAFLRECMADDQYLGFLREKSFREGGSIMILHLKTRGQDNICAHSVLYKPLMKHVFLQQPDFVHELTAYYKSRGFGWVDVLCVNKCDWKIFLFPPEAHQFGTFSKGKKFPRNLKRLRETVAPDEEKHGGSHDGDSPNGNSPEVSPREANDDGLAECRASNEVAPGSS